jgi:hypothetical protein
MEFPNVNMAMGVDWEKRRRRHLDERLVVAIQFIQILNHSSDACKSEKQIEATKKKEILLPNIYFPAYFNEYGTHIHTCY